jgi:hypothetical protein
MFFHNVIHPMRCPCGSRGAQRAVEYIYVSRGVDVPGVEVRTFLKPYFDGSRLHAPDLYTSQFSWYVDRPGRAVSA